MNDISTYLYDADGSDRQVELNETVVKNLSDNQLLWVKISARKQEVIEQVGKMLGLKNIPVKSILNVSERPKIDKFDDFYRLFVVSAGISESGKLYRAPIDFLVGRNFIVTVHDGDISYFEEFLEHKKGETQIGKLDSEGFLATLLDLHTVSYFRAVEKIEIAVDEIDKRILIKDMDEKEFLKDMVRLRADVSKLRKWYLPHRDVFYALARPDFLPIGDSQPAEDFKYLNHHFESVIDTLSNSRDSVFGLFDLYTTRASHKMNNTMRRLTFVTLIVGASSVVAGILGMNFKEDFFDSPAGFWYAIGGMFLIGIALTIIAYFRRWI